ncbi:MAG: DNA repair protein RecN [Solirubrobacterales bacterium]
MLREMRIENLLLIERAELRLEPGLNVITGETGAGKTVLAHSLDLLMGGRARAQLVRPGEREAWVEGTFDVPGELLAEPELAEIAERLPAGAEEIVLGRRVSASGRTAAFIAGRTATAPDLRLLGSRLLAFYGQHEHRRLTLASAQAEILDGFAGPAHLELRERYQAAHRECARLRAELDELTGREGSRERDLDLFRFELSEIEAVSPDPTRAAEMEAERRRLRGAEALRDSAASALAGLSGSAGEDGAAGLLASARAALEDAEDLDPALAELGERLGACALEAADIATSLRAYLDSAEADPGRLVALEEGLAEIERLKRKHGGSVGSVLEHAERCRAEIERLQVSGEREEALRAELERAEAGRSGEAEALTRGRAEAASRLAPALAGELEALAMPGARLEVELRPHPDGLAAGGAEVVEMRVAASPGLEPAPLRDAASGGELSRVMLALCGLAERGGAATLVFDEIDAGVGGRTAKAVGARLRRLGDATQVLCITHLPQVASQAAAHFRIEKRVEGEGTTALVERVEGEALVAEIARMLGGEGADDAAGRHAREMLAAA